MKIIFAIITAALFMTQAYAAQAEQVDVALELPPTFIQESCPTPIWKTKAIIWRGAKDKRSEPEIGSQTQKNKDPILVAANPTITKAFDDAAQRLLKACGVTLVAKGDDEAPELTLEIKQFYVGVEKKLVSGTDVGKSEIEFTLTDGSGAHSFGIGSQMDSKSIRQKSIKQLSSTLNKLFAETLKGVPTLTAFGNALQGK